MSCKSGKPIEEVAQEGPGLVFVVYPEALATMPGATIWSIIFFLMLLTLGLDSSVRSLHCQIVPNTHVSFICQFGGSEAIITGLSDEFPIIRRYREIFVALLFTLYMFIGIAMCTEVRSTIHYRSTYKPSHSGRNANHGMVDRLRYNVGIANRRLL